MFGVPQFGGTSYQVFIHVVHTVANTIVRTVALTEIPSEKILCYHPLSFDMIDC
jgi:hypothetical protein